MVDVSPPSLAFETPCIMIVQPLSSLPLMEVFSSHAAFTGVHLFILVRGLNMCVLEARKRRETLSGCSG